MTVHEIRESLITRLDSYAIELQVADAVNDIRRRFTHDTMSSAETFENHFTRMFESVVDRAEREGVGKRNRSFVDRQVGDTFMISKCCGDLVWVVEFDLNDGNYACEIAVGRL